MKKSLILMGTVAAAAMLIPVEVTESGKYKVFGKCIKGKCKEDDRVIRTTVMASLVAKKARNVAVKVIDAADKLIDNIKYNFPDGDGCMGCNDCIDCTDCIDCNDCIECTDCIGCDNCVDCIDCVGCIGCMGCVGLIAEHHKINVQSDEKSEKVDDSSSTVTEEAEKVDAEGEVCEQA